EEFAFLGYELLMRAGRKRGFLISGGEIDTERMARILLDEFRGGKLGRITLETPEEYEHTAEDRADG
ncbi:MAG: ribosome biogenesis GTPase YlqF, partial [Butyricicoccus sp.]